MAELISCKIVTKTPEVVETKKSTDWLVSKLCRGEKWATFLGISLLTDNKKHAAVNLEPMRQCLDLPLEDLFCQGKHFFFIFPKNITIHAHLIMKGSWTDYYEAGAQFKMTFKFDEDDKNIDIYYLTKRFGFFEVLEGDDALANVLVKLAPCFLGRNLITEEIWMQRFKAFTKRKNLRNVLMDQNGLVAGIGNYILAEVYYRAKLHWKTTVGDLDDNKRRELFHICKNFIEGMYNGTEMKVVYKQKVDPLGNPVIGVKMSDNRTFWSVPAIQGPN